MNHLTRILVVAALAGVSATGDIAAQTPAGPASMSIPSTAVSAADRTFMKRAASSAMAQVQFGQLAANKAASEQVRDLGNRMVAAYTTNGEQLRRLAVSKGVELPADIPAAQRREYHRLATLPAVEFEQEYVKFARSLQFNDVSNFRSRAHSARDPDLRTFARNSLPVVEEQLELVVFAAAMTLA